jgi:hypothetical protein
LRPSRRQRRGGAIALAATVALAVASCGEQSETAAPPAFATSGPGPATVAAVSRSTAIVERDRRARLQAFLERAIRPAAESGQAEIAVQAEGWRQPIVATTSGREPQNERLWSVSKVLTATLLYRVLGWDDQKGEALPGELRQALAGALVRSENCRQRLIVGSLQQRLGGIPELQDALEDLVEKADAAATISSEQQLPETDCLPYLERHAGTADPGAEGLLLGTSEWRVSDAAQLMTALSSGALGESVGDQVLGWLRQPKLPSREVAPGELTVDPAWGAGVALGELRPAYKPGWGGSQQARFLASQLISVKTDALGQVAIAVNYRPAAQPPVDDPALTPAPPEVEAILGDVGAWLQREGG